MQAEPTPLFTVCTPTYNRAKLLKRAYDSMAKQTLRDFEWVVVDDGSTDNTAEVMAEFIAKGDMPIRYLRKKNGGKHTALNLAVREGKGTLFTVIDSDDWFQPNALERMKAYWDEIPLEKRPRLKGVVGLFAYENGDVVGDKYPSDRLEADDLDLLLKYQVDGDKIGFTRMEVMREFPFPGDLSDSVEGVVYLTESLVWHRMGRKYPTIFVNEVFALKEYQQGGITDRGRIIQARNSKATLQYALEIITAGRKMPLKIAIHSYSNFIRHSLHEHLQLGDQMAKVPSKALFLLCLPIGFALYRKDQRLFRLNPA